MTTPMRPVRPLTVLAALLVGFAMPARAAIEDCAGDLTPSSPMNRIVELPTPLGSICIELLENEAPEAVANFIAYLEAGLYDGTFFHRSVTDFILQGGGYHFVEGAFEPIPKLDPVINEPCVLDEPVDPMDPDGLKRCSHRGNDAGTLAMAKLGDPECADDLDPMEPIGEICVPRPDWITTLYPREEYVNSATNQFFINLVDNRANLDNQSGGFTVFARVLGDGLLVADAITALPHVRRRLLPYSINADPLANVLPAFADLPVLARPEDDPQGYGCFDVADLAMLYDNQMLATPTLDPEIPRGFVVSGACGTLVPPDMVNLMPSDDPECSDFDHIALGIADFYQGPYPPIVNREDWFELTCGIGFCFVYVFKCTDIQNSRAGLALRRADISAKIAAQMMSIGDIVVAPEPADSLLAAASLLTIAGLARRRRVRADPGRAR